MKTISNDGSNRLRVDFRYTDNNFNKPYGIWIYQEIKLGNNWQGINSMFFQKSEVKRILEEFKHT